MTGSGSRAVVAKLTPADLAAAPAASIRPDPARIVVVGDVDTAAAVAALDRAFGDWAAPATPAPTTPFALPVPDPPQPKDRESVREGKRVAVRGHCGGRRNF